MITQKEKADEQKKKKGRLVARGFQEQESPQSDSPTMFRESFTMYFAVAVNEGFSLMSIDIRTPFLQVRGLDWKVFLEPPQDVKRKGRFGYSINLLND